MTTTPPFKRPPAVDDPAINTAVEGQLSVDPAVSTKELSIKTWAGVVTLTGTVPTIRARERAVALAEAVKGVKAVIDRIDVKPVRRADAAIRSDVIAALRSDPVAEAYQLTVDVKGGQVTLGGQVESWQEVDLAQNVVESVSGVAAVKNRIRVLPTAARSDAEIGEEVRRLLENDTRVMAALVTVHVDGGQVKLKGAVCSAAERTRALSLAYVKGVLAVDVSALDVRWLLCDEMRRKAPPAPKDSVIASALRLAFSYDPRVKSLPIKVDVDGGVVTLRGTVDNLMAKRAAAQDARNTTGVVGVDNRLTVKARWQLSDAELAQMVRAAIGWNPDLSRMGLHVGVTAGIVELHGTVENGFDRRLALEVVSRIRGVAAIRDRLQVNSSAPEPDNKILVRVRRQLFWNPRLDEDRIKVDVAHGVVTLSGTVSSWTARAQAAEEAREGGAWRVKNKLEVGSLAAVGQPAKPTL